MDYLDSTKWRRQIRQLYIGYVLVAVAIGLAVTMLLLLAYGYRLNKDGQVVQTGLLFLTTRPAGADVVLSGTDTGQQTNRRFNIDEGTYNVQLERQGYDTWQHTIRVIGGNVVRFDYPFLFPSSLTTTTVKDYAAAPTVASESSDNRWLLVEQTPGSASFDMFDLNSPKQAPTTVTVPAADYTAGGRQTWRFVDWASDKNHIILQHGYGTKGAVEFVLLNRANPAQSVNLSSEFSMSPTEVNFVAAKYDHYYIYSSKTRELDTANLAQPKPVLYLSDVLAYEPYQNNTMLYVTLGSSDQAVNVDLRVGTQTYAVRQLPAKTSYELAISSYSGDLYAAVAAHSGSEVYLYKNPVAQITGNVQKQAAPYKTLPLNHPAYISFSSGGRLMVAQSGHSFAAYDALYKHSYQYTLPQPIDKGQPHATWMDGAHQQYVSGGKLYVFDYDGTNAHLLMPAVSDQLVFYDNNYHFVYSLAPTAKAKDRLSLTSTALLTPADQ